MHLTNHGILDIVNLAFYVPALPITAYVVFKQGFARKAGWIYLTLVSILRIIGAITGLLAMNNPTKGLIECSDITYGIGITPLLLALLGILSRVNQSMSMPKFSPRAIHIINIPIMIGLIFAVLGGLNEFNSNITTQNNGIRDLKISTAIYAAMLGVLAVISVILFLNFSAAKFPERILLKFALLSLPFFGVRVLYSVLTAYDRTSSAFNTNSNATEAVIVQAAMSVAMEFVIMTVYILGGFMAMKASAIQAQQQKGVSETSSFDQPSQQFDTVPQFGYSRPPAQVAYTGGYNGVAY